LKKERLAQEAKKNATRFWDGFQWVDRPAAPTQQSEAGTATAASIQNATSTKDRRIYIGNLPAAITADVLKEFGNT
jgi:hypothetical protein